MTPRTRLNAVKVDASYLSRAILVIYPGGMYQPSSRCSLRVIARESVACMRVGFLIVMADKSVKLAIMDVEAFDEPLETLPCGATRTTARTTFPRRGWHASQHCVRL